MPTTEPKICPRCLVGVDNDNDGDCTACASVSDNFMVLSSFKRNKDIQSAVKIAREAALEELRMYMASATVDNPLRVIDDFKSRFPNHGDFERIYRADCNRQITVMASFEGPVLDAIRAKVCQ